MPRGTLEVLLVSAKGLDNTDFLSGMDPYAILTCRTQEKKSSVAQGQGTNPEWNEIFLFTISSCVDELKIKLMDKDTFTSDDFVGEATEALMLNTAKRRTLVDGSNHPWSSAFLSDEFHSNMSK